MTAAIHDAVIVSKKGILAAHYNPEHVQGKTLYIQNGTWEDLDAPEMIYCPDNQVVVMSKPLRGEGTQQDLVRLFSDLLATFTAEEIWSISRYPLQHFLRHPEQKNQWESLCKAIYKATVQPKTFVNVRGVLLEVTRKRGTVTLQLFLAGYDGLPRAYYTDKRIGNPEFLLRLWTPRKERDKYHERAINHAIFALEDASPYFEGIRMVNWPEGMKPIPYKQAWRDELLVREAPPTTSAKA